MFVGIAGVAEEDWVATAAVVETGLGFSAALGAFVLGLTAAAAAAASLVPKRETKMDSREDLTSAALAHLMRLLAEQMIRTDTVLTEGQKHQP